MKCKVAVIGAGISGLSCAFKLAKNGISVKIFETQALAGGRASRAVRVFPQNSYYIQSLLNELNFKGSERTELSLFGSYKDNKLMSFTQFAPFILEEKDLSFFKRLQRKLIAKILKVDLNQLRNLQDYMKQIEFDFETDSEEAKRLHSMTMKEWSEDYSTLREILFDPMLQFLFQTKNYELSAKICVNHIKNFLSISKDGGFYLKGGPFEVTQELLQQLDDSKICEVSFLTHVNKIVGKSKKVLEYSTGGDTYKEDFDYVVLAIPLPSAAKLLNTEFDLEYSTTKCYYVKGELKYPWVVAAGPYYDKNFRCLYSISEDEHVIATIDKNKELGDVSVLFKKENYSIIEESEIENAMPTVYPGQKLPNLDLGNNFFISGDFYEYPDIESAIASAYKVSDMIIKKESQP